MTTTRTIDQLGYDVSADVRHAIALLRERYGASNHRDTGHTQGRPTWIFKLPSFGAEVGVPMNKNDLTLYVRNRTLDGRKLTDLLPAEKIAKVYPRDGSPAHSIKNSRFLKPSVGNECVKLALERSDLEPLFEKVFDAAATEDSSPPGAIVTARKSRPQLDAETFRAMLERRSEVGEAGELAAVEDELRRLADIGCPDPERWAERVALADVGRGYDIASTWPGHERYIEVKSSTSTGNGVYLSVNERDVLAELGDKAWLYRVLVKADGTGEVLLRLRDPVAALPAEVFEPVVFRVSADALAGAAESPRRRHG